MSAETRYPGNFNPTDELMRDSLKNETPRRACIWLFTPAEKAIYDTIGLIEGMGADTLLSEAQCLLAEAQRKVADYVDKQL